MRVSRTDLTRMPILGAIVRWIPAAVILTITAALPAAAIADDGGPPPPTAAATKTGQVNPLGDNIIVTGDGFPAEKSLTVSTWALTDTGTASPDAANLTRTIANKSGQFTAKIAVSAKFAAALGPRYKRFEIRVIGQESGTATIPTATIPIEFGPPPIIEPTPTQSTLDRPTGKPPAYPNPSKSATNSPIASPTPIPSVPAATEEPPINGANRGAVLALTPMRAATGQGTQGPSLTVPKTTNLNPAGETVTVTGSGYDTTKGIYLALCVDNGPGVAPSPCIGGADMEGSSGSQVWISSNPPPYGEGLAKPYGPDGTFTFTLRLVAKDTMGNDCTKVRCSVVTRADHTRTSDRTQDVRIPVTFGAVQSNSPTPDTSTAAGNPTNNPTQSANTPPGGTLPQTGASGITPLLVTSMGFVIAGATVLTIGRPRQRQRR